MRVLGRLQAPRLLTLYILVYNLEMVPLVSHSARVGSILALSQLSLGASGDLGCIMMTTLEWRSHEVSALLRYDANCLVTQELHTR